MAGRRVVWVWERRAGAQATELPGSAGVFGLAFSPDGRTLSGADGETVRLWDVRSGTPLGRPLPDAARSTAFGADGLVLASNGNGLRLWDGIFWRDPADLRTRVCSLALGDLTRAEWAAVAPGIAYRKVCG